MLVLFPILRFNNQLLKSGKEVDPLIEPETARIYRKKPWEHPEQVVGVYGNLLIEPSS